MEPSESHPTMPSDSSPPTTKVKSQGRGRSNSLPANVVEYLKAWLMSPDHIHHPYPTEKEKAKMVADTGIELKRLNNWFVNNRIRYWKPKMEALQRQENRHEGLQSVIPCETSSRSPWLEQVVKIVPEVKDRLQSSPHQSTSPSSPSSFCTTRTVSDSSSSASLSVSSTDDSSVGDGSAARFSDEEILMQLSSSQLSTSATTPTRKRKIDDECTPSPRTKYSRKDADLWRDACIAARRKNDENLPTLDEAALLFGFAQDQ